MNQYLSTVHIRSSVRLLILAIVLSSGVACAQQAAPPYEGYADLPGVRIFYKDTGGAGEPVVFMHAATGNLLFWEHQIPAFTAAGYRMIMYDRRGWGRSIVDTSTGTQPGTAADDLIALLDHLDLDRVHIVATAAGGSITWDFALAYPERVISMVISTNNGRVDEPEYRALVASLRPEGFDELPPEFRELGPSYRATNPEGTRHWLELEELSRPEGPLMDTQPLKNRLTFDLISTVETPVLVIRGGADIASPAPLHRYFTERVDSAEVLVIPDAGHSAYWETPEIFNQAVLDFIGKN